MFDKVTEIVAHMVGIFQITIEEERMREAYEKFKAMQLADPETGDLLNVEVTLKAPYSLGDFAPALKYAAPGPDSTPQPHHVGRIDLANPVPLSFGALLPQNSQAPYFAEQFGSSTTTVTTTTITTPLTPEGTSEQLTQELDPPSSVVTVTLQFAYLDDNDALYMNGDPGTFLDPGEFLTALEGFYATASSLGGPSLAQVLNDGAPTLAAAKIVFASVSQPILTTGAGETATVLQGDDAYGTFTNGEAVEDVPILDDVMPAFFRQDNPETVLDSDVPVAETAQDRLAETDPFEGVSDTSSSSTPRPPEIDDGHLVVTGANTLINETSVYVSWLDAPEIAVTGDVVNITSVSQVNVLVEHTSFNGTSSAAESSTFNTAMTSLQSSNPDAAPASAENSDPLSQILPSNWAVTMIEGDLLSLNWVSQFSFVTDHDRADIQFTGTNTYIGLGDNTVVNLTNLAEIGFGYDLIMVGGNMISINQIHQINVLMDNDTITSTGGVGFNFSGSDNLLFNGASISTVGIDSYSDMRENFAAANTAFAQGANNIDENVAHDAAFEGDGALSVLYISGDLTTINWIEQTNVIGDSDQINFELGNFNEQTGESVQLVSGSNAAINLASIQIAGMDSNVQVGGEVYSDALLYQGELIDTDADPTGVAMPALATEAVAFLADDMMGTGNEAPLDAEIVATASTEQSATSDAMQSMLA